MTNETVNNLNETVNNLKEAGMAIKNFSIVLIVVFLGLINLISEISIMVMIGLLINNTFSDLLLLFTILCVFKIIIGGLLNVSKNTLLNVTYIRNDEANGE